MLGHEIHGGRTDALGGHDEIALVLAIGVIDHDDHASLAQVGEGGLNRIKYCRHGWRLTGCCGLEQRADWLARERTVSGISGNGQRATR
jgi:hypothetical protein